MKSNKILKERSKFMKKVLMITLAVLISIAFVTTVFAQTTTDKAATKAAAEKAAGPAAEKAAKPAAEKAAGPAAEKAVKAAEKKEAKPKVHQFTGEVTAIDTAAKTLNVKKGKDEKAFDIANATMKAEPKAGDKVLVKYTEKDGKNIASSVAVTKKAAVKKDEVKKDEKPAAAAPATTPAPAAPAKK
jgi:hypothetical protein